ncbi:acyltransferase family protein [Solidesulfovibrio alcoholivorans]|uniref:acyltransferase family protein n=1 Tax=Solidesulfovibrio alcoholivorans TaxID=81406 RepID=UPI000693CCB3|nr:heparan-alpha-glucosaminide N-acetyltransferase domain-containing protein [Solidesulfovibrio alcoholivorans]
MHDGARTALRTGKRLASVDCLRGLAVAGMILANNPGDQTHVYAPLRHAAWHGATAADLVFPLFLFLVGASVALAVDREAVAAGLVPGFRLRALKRVCVLFLLGLGENAWLRLSVAALRIPGVLQRIAVVYAVAAWLHVRVRADRTLVAIVAGALLGYWLLLAWAPVPGLGQPSLAREANLEGWLDQFVFGRHIWKAGTLWDPEGVLSTLPAAALGLVGVLAGRWLRRGGTGAFGVAAAGAAMIALGLAWDAALPFNKSLFTSSFACFAGGVGVTLLAVAHRLLDGPEHPAAWAAPLQALGKNALAVYVAASLAATVLRHITLPAGAGVRTSLQTVCFRALFGGWPDPYAASLAWAVLFLLAAWGAAAALAARGLTIRA